MRGRWPAVAIRALHPGANVKLIRAREEAGLSRPELAEHIGISRFFLYSVEIGFRNARLEIMQRWAQALNVPLDIFAADPPRPSPRAAA